METIWFILVAIFLIGYAVLDGFDLGIGSMYLLVAKTEAERDQVRSSIGLIWDGDEVWLIASGGMLFFAFPKAYATAFNSFYLALFLILWLYFCWRMLPQCIAPFGEKHLPIISIINTNRGTLAQG